MVWCVLSESFGLGTSNQQKVSIVEHIQRVTHQFNLSPAQIMNVKNEKQTKSNWELFEERND